MRNFFTSMLGALVALWIFLAGVVVLLVAVGAAMTTMGRKVSTVVEPGSYLVFDLSTNIVEAPVQENPLAGFASDREETLQMRSVTRALRAAANDSRIAGVFLTGSLEPQGYDTGFAALKEVREALGACRAAGKPVVAYLNFARTRDLYLASAANDVVFDPYGALFLPGLASQPMFLTGALEKFGIGVQVTRVGKYKSFVEPFIRKDMSPENRAQTQKLLDDLWSQIVGDIATSRGLTPAAMQKAVDEHGLFTAEQAKAAGLVDRIAYRDEILAELKTKTGRTGAKEVFKQVALADYASALPESDPATKPTDKTIAVAYAEGDIVDGEGVDGEIGGDKFSRMLRELRLDDSVQAIVLRVNSPGGSATASEEIQRELRLTRKTKPVIVSMGTVAASGGYWISAYGDKIYAEPTTITGSIGVFGLFFNVQKLAGDLGLTFDVAKTGKFADALTISRPKTDEELALFQQLVDWIYGQFIGKVSEGRHLDRAAVEEIAQGRVWSGTEAKKLGLVDEIGGLDAAIKFAAQKAQLGDNYRVVEYPRTKELTEVIVDWIQGQKHDQTRATDALSQLMAQIKEQAKTLHEFNDPRGLYARLPLEMMIK
ncbi:MAG TPA: signal peptide peptidase SppA [Opitutaceae bacterium]|jgi:protease-4|nr:signal peptide peptidase SppA [Opitutaceae bacterium]